MKEIVTTFDILISTLNSYEDDWNIYLKNYDFNEYDICLIASAQEDLDEIKGFKYIFGIYVLKDIVDNLYQQNPQFTTKDALKATKFYYQTDAFIDLGIKSSGYE